MKKIIIFIIKKNYNLLKKRYQNNINYNLRNNREKRNNK